MLNFKLTTGLIVVLALSLYGCTYHYQPKKHKDGRAFIPDLHVAKPVEVINAQSQKEKTFHWIAGCKTKLDYYDVCEGARQILQAELDKRQFAIMNHGPKTIKLKVTNVIVALLPGARGIFPKYICDIYFVIETGDGSLKGFEGHGDSYYKSLSAIDNSIDDFVPKVLTDADILSYLERYEYADAPVKDVIENVRTAEVIAFGPGIDRASSAKVKFSPEIELLNVPIEKFIAVMDLDGFAHVLAIASEKKNLNYLIIGPEGIRYHEIVKRLGPYLNLDLAVDHKGRLHAIVDEEHLILKEGMWKTSSMCRCMKIIPYGKDLACAFVVNGKEVGSPIREASDPVLGPGAHPAMLPLIFLDAEYTYGKKLVIAREADNGWSNWTVVERDTKHDSNNFRIVADNCGTLHVLYRRSKAGLAYVRLPLPAEPKIINKSPEVSSSNHKETLPPNSTAVSGQDVCIENDIPFFNIAADPESCETMIAGRGLGPDKFKIYSRNVIGGEIGPPVSMLSVYVNFVLTSAGGGKFHALFLGETLDYSVCSNNNIWSFPIELGKAVFEIDLPLPKMVSDGFGNALAIWLKEENLLVSRWIKLVGP